ncbi:MAG: EAL domain-containing protein [Actinobacteria bacterium]|nr:EAL domain-containing protein [Actinomycetota bacterium]MBW3648691.1 EAL domain-containing protein [Actinomycetota bacterium]
MTEPKSDTMTGLEVGVSPVRRVAVLSISLGLLIVGLVLALESEGTPLQAPFAFPAVLLFPLYLAAVQRPLDFEFRKDCNSITLTQLPLALGVLLVSPGLHLLMRLAALLVDSVALRRLSPVKVAYNIGAATFEIGLVTAVVAAVPPSGTPGPMLWLALYVGLLIGDLVGNAALQGIWWLLGRRSTRAEVLQPLTVIVVVSTVFTGVTVVAMAAAWTDSATIFVTLALASALALAYRGHRRQSAQAKSTEELHSFVKGLGPFVVEEPQAAVVLEQVRGLLHSRQLDLALCDRASGEWRHLVVSDGETKELQQVQPVSAADLAAQTGTPSLAGHGRSGESQRMTTPLMGSARVMGVLTAQDRLGTVRGFDMGDLRLLETIGAELATALERGRLLADLERAATTDPLTNLPNLTETARQLTVLLDATTRGVVLAAVAVDSFREVNDTLGHQVGDELLVEVASRLRRALPNAMIGRIGGGRFAVAVSAEAAGHEPAMFFLDLRSQIEGSAQIGAVGAHVKLSVGCVNAPEHGSDATTLLRRAETAMYSARRAFGGPVAWEPVYEVKGQRQLAVVMALREALSTGAIGVVFQAKVATVGGEVTGVEALARWTHPALGAIRPDEFIPLAEASGLMGPLTASVVRQSLLACTNWQRSGRQVGVAVNVSAETVLDPAFVTQIEAILTSTGVPAGLLTLELTEGVLVHDADLAVVRMRELRTLGVKLSVDDFGTGYSSLLYLRGLPVDEVKIDKGFVDGVTSEPADRAVVRAVVDIAHTLGLRVVAEGVEQPEQQAVLRTLGVDEVQGYLNARPMPATDITAWLWNRVSQIHS